MDYPLIDARCKSCPEPVIMTKKAITNNPEGIIILVDNIAARDNVTRFGNHAGYQVHVVQDEKDYKLTLCK